MCETKICTKCKEEKSLNEFGKASKEKSGLKSACKVCCNKYYEENKERLLNKQKEYYNNNKEYILKRQKQYIEDNKELIKEQRRRYYNNNSEVIKQSVKDYELLNREHLNSKKLERHKNRIRNDSLYRLKCNIRSLIFNSYKRFLEGKESKSEKTINILGCSFEEFKQHIESQFLEWMTWNNYGDLWEIDHIYPHSLAKDEEELIKLNHYTNLRPLCKYLNRSKGNKIE